MDYAIKAIIILILFLLSIQDLLFKEVSLWIILVGMVIIFVMTPFTESFTLFNSLAGTFVGISVIALSKATDGKIGIADGIIFIIVGVTVGGWGSLELFVYSLFLSAFVSVVLMLFKQANRKTSIPFIPFILMGYLCLIFIR